MKRRQKHDTEVLKRKYTGISKTKIPQKQSQYYDLNQTETSYCMGIHKQSLECVLQYCTKASPV